MSQTKGYRYPTSVRKEAVSRIHSGLSTVVLEAERLGTSYSTVHRWMALYPDAEIKRVNHGPEVLVALADLVPRRRLTAEEASHFLLLFSSMLKLLTEEPN